MPDEVGPDTWRILDDPVEPVGIHPRARPVIAELPLQAGETAIAFTDGLVHAGTRRGVSLDPLSVVRGLGCPPRCQAKEVADALLNAAFALDEGRLADDVTVVVLQILECPETQGPSDGIRRMTVSFPISPT
jgi:serine phosphatase RsbU (regulator of sigma subunit)